MRQYGYRGNIDRLTSRKKPITKKKGGILYNIDSLIQLKNKVVNQSSSQQQSYCT
jgi:hypothetical protein